MPLDRCGAQVASQQSLILRNGKVQNTLVAIGVKRKISSARPLRACRDRGSTQNWMSLVFYHPRGRTAIRKAREFTAGVSYPKKPFDSRVNIV